MTSTLMNEKNPLNTALVTGGAGGIGQAIARRLYDAGMKVCVWDMNPVDPGRIGSDATRLMSRVIDVTDDAAVSQGIQEIAKCWGGVSVLINNAGISPKTSEGKGRGILDVSTREWTRVLDVNLTSLLRLIQLTAPHMIQQGWGRIINLASQAGRTRATVPGVAYVCTKTAVIGLSRYAADELGAHGITVNTLAPGRIISDMTATAGETINAAFIARTPVRRMGTPDDVAAAAAFYVSEQASFLSGTILDVNGGLHMP